MRHAAASGAVLPPLAAPTPATAEALAAARAARGDPQSGWQNMPDDALTLPVALVAPNGCVSPHRIARECNSNALRVQGIGEPPQVGAAAAIAHALYYATGVRMRRLPIRIADVLA